ncbi:VWA domain-containing protein [Myxococcota bacterium]|nr:VWA domain-containing protein [Myxococcota bacterium]MBU1413681.1 VWA domain-containing protein [Myxococcota bacterium]MBU1509460.1 VWA domain-containing protein [Myxococcota bacterium]
MTWKHGAEFLTWAGWGFWLAVGVLLFVFGLVLAHAVSRRRFERLGEGRLLARLISRRSAVLPVLRPVLQVSGLILLLFALATPQTSGQRHNVSSMGLDVVVALDFSKSMNVRDMFGSRLEHARREMNHLIDRLGGDQLGLVAFAGTTMVYPLTTDHESAKLFWENLRPEDLPVGGTAIARALDSARELLTDVRDPKVDRAQVIILLSDGEDHLGRPSEAASELNKLGIKVFTVGIGSSEGQLVPSLGETGEVTGYVKHDMQYVTSKLDEATLMNIAQVTGGQYFRATKEDFGTDRVIAAISDYKRSQAEKQVFVEKHEEFIWFLLPGLFLLLVDFLLLGNAGLRRQKKEASA